MKFCFLYDCVVICCSEEEIKIVGGIVLLGFVVEKLNCGEVVVVGIGCVLDNGEVCVLVVKVGDKVVFGFYFGSNVIKVDGEELLVMGEFEIFVVLED